MSKSGERSEQIRFAHESNTHQPGVTAWSKKHEGEKK